MVLGYLFTPPQPYKYRAQNANGTPASSFIIHLGPMIGLDDFFQKWFIMLIDILVRLAQPSVKKCIAPG